MDNQLTERYLEISNYEYGLFVIGWYESPYWHLNKDYRCKQIPFANIEESRNFFDEQAERLSLKSGKKIRAIVIDLSLK
ncbi:hypothetical protein [Clostridium sp. Marseille-Q7071]